MTREEWKSKQHLIEAFIEGETIQFFNGSEWEDIEEPEFADLLEYRIKPEEPKPRPFKDCEELIAHWNKKFATNFRPASTMPLVWVKHKVNEARVLITCFGKDYVKFGAKTKPISMYDLFVNYTFLDDSPCGVIGIEETEETKADNSYNSEVLI